MKPILFNTAMVKALLDGRKTVTRKLVRQGVLEAYGNYDEYCTAVMPRGGDISCTRTYEKEFYLERAPYKTGDVLWVRETWQLNPDGFDEVPPEYWWSYRATNPLPSTCTKWRPSIFMPKSAARIFLKVTDVRVERLQDITPEQADKEGVGNLFMAEIAYSDIDDGYGAEIDDEYGLAREQFAYLWQSTIKKQDIEEFGWDANPYVFRIEFERCDKPEVV